MRFFHLSRGVLVSCVLLGCLAVGSPPRTVQADQADAEGTPIYAFGVHLFQLGEYYRAITELKRFTILFPQHQRALSAQVLIGLALQEDGSDDDALTHFQRLRQIDHADVSRLATFKLGELRFWQQQYQQAAAHFQEFLQLFPDGPLVPHTRYLLSLSWALEGQTDRAQRLLDTFPAQHGLAEQAQALQLALQTPPPDAAKSPRTAGILAGLLPGAGHLYIGKPIQALTAFLLNGLFITGSVFAFREGLEATGAILLYFEIGWYLGNIKSATAGAREANRHQQTLYTDHLRTTYAPAPLSLRDLQTPGIGLRLSF